MCTGNSTNSQVTSVKMVMPLLVIYFSKLGQLNAGYMYSSTAAGLARLGQVRAKEKASLTALVQPQYKLSVDKNTDILCIQ